jgi:HPt (histidine-containing phosphotransfer) domain-containing protein
LAACVPVSVNNGPDGAGKKPGDGTMQLAALRTIDSKDAPSLAPDDRPIDLVHLARMTLGDRSLEREVLQLFDRQSALLIARMRNAAPDGIVTIAHTMKGSARGIGAWRVARAAEAVELSGSAEIAGALAHLAAAADEARAVIADLLKAN